MRSILQRSARALYVRWIRPRIPERMHQQRLKLVLWDGWGYLPLLFLPNLSPSSRLGLLVRFLRVDWRVPHAHKPCEIVAICRALAGRRANPGEVIVEAGCWQGGSSAKLSLICALLGYRLRIYDSFEGVEPMTPEELAGGAYDFSGEYAASERLVRRHLERYGVAGVCSLHGGWFAETLAVRPVAQPVRLAYIDCDLAKGTREALSGIVPALVADGWIFSQDYHIRRIRELLEDGDTWAPFGRGIPCLTPMCHHLAAIRFPRA